MDDIVAATLDSQRVVLAAFKFDNDERLQRFLEASKKKGLTIKLMPESEAKKSMADSLPCEL